MAKRNPFRLPLSSAAKKALAAVVVAGAIAIGVVIIGILVSGPATVNSATALAQVKQAGSVLARSLRGFQPAIRNCKGQLGCVTGLVRSEANDVATFNSQIRRISLSGSAATDAATLISADDATLRDLDQLAAATSNVQYLNVATAKTATFQQDVNNAAAAYAKLVKDLGGITH
jgi:hypothetical protein